MTTEPNVWEKIMAYVAEHSEKAALEAEIEQEWSTEKNAQDPLEEVDLGDDSIKRPTYINTKINKDFKIQIIELLKKYKDCFTWDYYEMPSLSRDVVELKLPIRPNKKPVKQNPRRNREIAKMRLHQNCKVCRLAS